MTDYKELYRQLAERQKELLNKEKSPEGLTEAEEEELRETIAKKSSLQEQVSYPD